MEEAPKISYEQATEGQALNNMLSAMGDDAVQRIEAFNSSIHSVTSFNPETDPQGIFDADTDHNSFNNQHLTELAEDYIAAINRINEHAKSNNPGNVLEGTRFRGSAAASELAVELAGAELSGFSTHIPPMFDEIEMKKIQARNGFSM